MTVTVFAMNPDIYTYDSSDFSAWLCDLKQSIKVRLACVLVPCLTSYDIGGGERRKANCE